MIQLKYTELFSVEFIHDFYSGGICGDLRAEPAAATRDQLKSLGWILRRENGRFTVLAEVSGADGNDRPLLKRPLRKDVKLIFSLYLDQPNLPNFSELPLRTSPGERYYFSNLNRRVEAGRNLMTSPESAPPYVSAADLTPMKGAFYSYRHTAAAAERTGELSWPDSGEQLVQTLKNNDGRFDFSFRLDQLPQGRCIFRVNNVEKDRFYAARELTGSGLFGIVEVMAGNAVPNDYRFVVNNGRSVRFRRYSIVFARRTTFWRYILINKFGNDLTDPGVVRQNGAVLRFDEDTGAPSEGAYPAGSRVFVSREPLALQQDKLLNINLRRNFNPSNAGSGSVLIEHLPNPSVAQLKPDPSDPSRIYSDIYVYV